MRKASGILEVDGVRIAVDRRKHNKRSWCEEVCTEVCSYKARSQTALETMQKAFARHRAFVPCKMLLRPVLASQRSKSSNLKPETTEASATRKDLGLAGTL